MYNFQNFVDKIAQLVKQLNSNNNVINVEKAVEIAIEAEKFYIAARNEAVRLSAFSENYAPNDILSKTTKELGISIYQKNDSLFVKMPLLLPFKKLKNLQLQNDPNMVVFYKSYEHCNALIDALHFEFENYLTNHKIDKQKYTFSTFIYTHIFDSCFPKYRIPDTDNYEIKQITDTVINYVSSKDDGFQYISFHFDSVIGSSNNTILEIRPKGGGKNDKIC